MSLNIIPYTNVPFHYANNALYEVSSNTKVLVYPGQYRDADNTVDLVLGEMTELDTAVIGANGLDAGALAASTWYYLYIIGDSSGYKPTSVLLSASNSSPLLPFGYTSISFIGYLLTDGSANLIPMQVIGNGSYRQFFWVDSRPVLTAGTATTFTKVPLINGVPPVDKIKINLNISFTPSLAGDICQLRPSGFGTSVLTFSGVVASIAHQTQAELLAAISGPGDAAIDYLVSASGALSISVLGFSYSV